MTEQREEYKVPAVYRDDVLVPTWERMKEQAKILHDSGFFPKAIKKSSQALAVMLAGRELGLGPMESLRSIYIVDGQTCISSGFMAAMIWDAGHGYEIMESTEESCRIKFWRQAGITRTYYVHEFTIEEAARANLLGKFAWKSYPKAMLFNRCISGGARAFLPDIARRMYTPEEMGAPVTISEDGDVVIDAEVTEIESETATGTEETGTQEKANGDPPRPWEPDLLKAKMLLATEAKAKTDRYSEEPSQEQIGLLAGKLEEIWAGDKGSKQNRYELLGWITGRRSTKDLGLPWVATLLKWLLQDKDPVTGDYLFTEFAPQEARLVYKRAMIDQGQQEMPLDESIAKDLDDTLGNVEGRDA